MKKDDERSPNVDGDWFGDAFGNAKRDEWSPVFQPRAVLAVCLPRNTATRTAHSNINNLFYDAKKPEYILAKRWETVS